MKKYKILYTPPAKTDLNNMAEYIAKTLMNSTAAQKLYEKIKESIASLREMPTRCPVVADEDWAKEGIRKFPVDNYFVFYLISEENKTVIINRILYSRRYWEKLL